ncbi:unnamed protein product [Periconia digitata]|uniref:Uncharacterized protein n=1 Tax=Periconia digitata TaxID=1303443 RepID=A0A9W4UHG9_9PLEO|nr:unnamed protein product [Periconia digitata]
MRSSLVNKSRVQPLALRLCQDVSESFARLVKCKSPPDSNRVSDCACAESTHIGQTSFSG